MDVVTSHPRARVNHMCEVCGPTIKPGDTYTRAVTFDGDVFTWKNCTPCDDAIEQAREDNYDDGGIITGDSVREWAREHLGLYDAANELLRRIREAEHAAEETCTCVLICPEDPSENECAVCKMLDLYAACPNTGYGCGLIGGSCDCCTADQRANCVEPPARQEVCA